MAAKNALLVFIKTPKINFVKTRLATHLQPNEILSVYSAFLKDLDKQFKSLINLDLWYAVSPENLNLKVLAKVVDLSNYFLQKGNDLGDRMCHAFDYAFKHDYEKSILIGSDTPDLNCSSISEVFGFLDEMDCVLGPTFDGGYYLISMKKCHPELFTNINWSTDKVLSQTISRATESNLKLKLLKTLDDIDTYADLKNLHHRLKNMQKAHTDFPKNSWEVLNHILSE